MQTDLQQILESISNLEANLETKIKDSETRLETKINTFNEKFDNYQKATQSLVNLAFGLIASATIVTIVSNVFIRR
jgi:tetrahydromethanopterin S-methyltransferase subunit B